MIMKPNPSIRSLAGEFYAFLAQRFPVCCWSDEFVYFPQALAGENDWDRLDDLSPEAVQDAVDALVLFRARMAPGGENGEEDRGEDREERLLASTLEWVINTLLEQFTDVRVHATQPTFALTVATVGLVQGLRSPDPLAWPRRLRALPLFLQRASRSLVGTLPGVYLDLGKTMVRDLTAWIQGLKTGEPGIGALEALGTFSQYLESLQVREEFRLGNDLLERVVSHHTGSGIGLEEAIGELEEEASVCRQGLEREAGRLGAGSDWEEAFRRIPRDPLPGGGKVQLLREEIARLKDYCRQLGLPGTSEGEESRLDIEPLPLSLKTVRAADSYNAIPGHPFRGGVFFIHGAGTLGEAARALHPVYRMTAAHEVYPGHHLLDHSRWNHPDPARRPLEFPLFYEGWACFGEDLMFTTGAFDRPYDRLILWRRRYRHALRGATDLLLHRGDLDLPAAALRLTTAGFSAERAMDTARKYALRPAYQMCYTVGRRRFQKLYDSYGRGDVGAFVRTALGQGEVPFGELETALRNSGKKERGRGKEGLSP